MKLASGMHKRIQNDSENSDQKQLHAWLQEDLNVFYF